jgi:hypothetical protein
MPGRFGRFAALVAMLLVTLVVRPAARQRAWTYAATPNFEIYTTAGERRARDTLSDFERVHAFFADFLKLPPPTGGPTRIVLFSTADEYHPYRPNAVATAFYQTGVDRDHIVMRLSDDGGLRTIVHEYTHAVMRRANNEYPLWLNEGLAEFFSTMESSGRQMKLGQPPPSRMRLVQGGPLILLDRVFAMDLSSREYASQTHAGAFYSQSWALTHMLLADEKYRPGWTRFLTEITAGANTARALSVTYGKTVAMIARDLDAYIRRNHYGYWLTDYSPPPASTPQTRAVTAFEAGVVTANLLAGTERQRDAARAAFDTLAKENPNDPLLLEYRALFEFRAGNDDAAEPLMTKAIAAGSRSTELRIHHAAVLANLQKPAEALEALRALSPVPPTQAYLYYQALANAYMQNGDLVDAKEAAHQVRRHARPGAELEFAEKFAQSIDAVVGKNVFADGRIRNVVCNEGGPTVVELTVGISTLRVAIDNPSLVKLQGETARIELSCGRQDTPTRIGYLPSENAALKTAGVVRFLDFRPR